MNYKYGMKSKGCSVCNQPMDFTKCLDDPTGKYKNILIYERKLTDEEVSRYDFDLLEEGL